MNETTKIESTEEAWESGQLGRDEAYAHVFENEQEDALDKALELQMISIRLQKSLIEDFKLIAKLHGLGYQPLMRQILTRFADCEKKLLLKKFVADQEKMEAAEQLTDNEEPIASHG